MYTYSDPSFGESISNATSSKDLPPLSEMRRYSLLIVTKENRKARVINIHLFQLRLLQWRMMHDARSLFHSPRCIMGASLVNYVPPTSLETKTANATDASMLCQQNVKTMYFQTLKPRLFKTVIWVLVLLCGNICKCGKFSTSLLGSCTWEFWMELKKIWRRLLNYNN